jgi:predicted deacylase
LKIVVCILSILLIANIVSADFENLPLTNLTRAGNYYQYYPSRLNLFLNDLGSSVDLSSLGVTYYKNNLSFISFGAISGRKVVYIARQHGDEQAGSFMAEGFLEQALNDSSFLSRFMTYSVPMVNPDGALKNTLGNAKRQNLNRCWSNNLCYETNKVRDRLNMINLTSSDIFIDQHALNSGELYSYIIISSRQRLNSSVCNIVKKYLPTFQCSFDRHPTNGTARWYFYNKGVKYSILIETSQSNKTYTPAYVNNLGKNLVSLLENLP